MDSAPPFDERFIGYGFTRNTQVHNLFSVKKTSNYSWCLLVRCTKCGFKGSAFKCFRRYLLSTGATKRRKRDPSGARGKTIGIDSASSCSKTKFGPAMGKPHRLLNKRKIEIEKMPIKIVLLWQQKKHFEQCQCHYHITAMHG